MQLVQASPAGSPQCARRAPHSTEPGGSGRHRRAVDALYVGNLAFNTTEEDLSEALEHNFGPAIVIENVTIPSVNGKSKYGFIELSSAQATVLDIDDIMII